MPKSKNRKNHNLKLNAYKAAKKKEQEQFKKKMMENYAQMQQSNIANQQSHTSTEEVSGPDIDIDSLNITESGVTEDNLIIDIEDLNK